MKVKIETGTGNLKPIWTLWWLLSPVAMEKIMVNTERRTANIKIIATCVEDRYAITKNSIWFDVKHHYADLFTEISPDTLWATCCH